MAKTASSAGSNRSSSRSKSNSTRSERVRKSQTPPKSVRLDKLKQVTSPTHSRSSRTSQTGYYIGSRESTPAQRGPTVFDFLQLGKIRASWKKQEIEDIYEEFSLEKPAPTLTKGKKRKAGVLTKEVLLRDLKRQRRIKEAEYLEFAREQCRLRGLPEYGNYVELRKRYREEVALAYLKHEDLERMLFERGLHVSDRHCENILQLIMYEWRHARKQCAVIREGWVMGEIFRNNSSDDSSSPTTSFSRSSKSSTSYDSLFDHVSLLAGTPSRSPTDRQSRSPTQGSAPAHHRLYDPPDPAARNDLIRRLSNNKKVRDDVTSRYESKVETLQGFNGSPNGTKKFRKIPVEGDGNCLFRAVATALWGRNREYLYRMVKYDLGQMWTETFTKDTLMHEFRSWDYNEARINVDNSRDEDPTLTRDDYPPLYAQIHRGKAWGTEQVLQLISDCYNVAVFVWTRFGEGKEYHLSKYRGVLKGVTDPEKSQSIRNQPQIYIDQIRDHYGAFLPIDGENTGCTNPDFLDPDREDNDLVHGTYASLYSLRGLIHYQYWDLLPATRVIPGQIVPQWPRGQVTEADRKPGRQHFWYEPPDEKDRWGERRED